MTSNKRLEALRAHNDAEHRRVMASVETAIREIKALGKNVSYYAVAKRSGVSKTTLYNSPGVRQLVEQAKRGLSPASLDIYSTVFRRPRRKRSERRLNCLIRY